MRFPILATTLACTLLAGGAPLQARETRAPALPATGVVGIEEAQLSPGYWVGRLAHPDAVLLDRTAIDAENARLMRLDGSMHDLAQLPPVLHAEQVRGWIEGLSQRPDEPLFDADGHPVPKATLDALVDALDLGAVPAQQDTRFGMTLERADLRTFPTTLRVFSEQGDHDIDRFQESALFPGTPVAIVHRSRDGAWLFVVSPRYAAWVEARFIAEGTRAAVLDHAARTPFRVVTGAKVRTVFTPEQPQLSELQLDMGVRLPLAEVAVDAPVNGQHPYTSWAVQLPLRDASGRLAFAPALVQKNTDTADGYLPLTQANLIRQAFKFLGERYGWGHGYNSRDCSGFVSEVYASMGVQLPRNTGAQSKSPALDRIHFEPSDDRARRMAAVDGLQVGDLVYIPGHVMMMIGRVDGAPYVIHDTNGGSVLDPDGRMRSMHLNAVSVTPLLPLHFNASQTYVDRITNIVRIRPTADQGSTATP